jgi:hypothetical protein
MDGKHHTETGAREAVNKLGLIADDRRLRPEN